MTHSCELLRGCSGSLSPRLSPWGEIPAGPVWRLILVDQWEGELRGTGGHLSKGLNQGVGARSRGIDLNPLLWNCLPGAELRSVALVR